MEGSELWELGGLGSDSRASLGEGTSTEALEGGEEPAHEGGEQDTPTELSSSSSDMDTDSSPGLTDREEQRVRTGTSRTKTTLARAPFQKAGLLS